MIFCELFKVLKIKSKYTIMDFAEYIDETGFLKPIKYCEFT